MVTPALGFVVQLAYLNMYRESMSPMHVSNTEEGLRTWKGRMRRQGGNNQCLLEGKWCCFGTY